jgi:hypothetical protein
MTKDILGRWQCEIIQGVGTSGWHFCKTEITILELNPSVGGAGYVEVTNDNIDRINSGVNVSVKQWALGTVLTSTMDWMYSVTAFRVVTTAGTCRLSATGRGYEK